MTLKTMLTENEETLALHMFDGKLCVVEESFAANVHKAFADIEFSKKGYGNVLIDYRGLIEKLNQLDLGNTSLLTLSEVGKRRLGKVLTDFENEIDEFVEAVRVEV
jgi:hypothetical protein